MMRNSEFNAAFIELADRLQRYGNSSISEEISPYDDMFDATRPDGREHYDSVGRGAIEIVCAALATARKGRVRRFLDMPCGGGRVTRHLVAFFHEAAGFVSDIDERKMEFCRRAFNCSAIKASTDFGTISHGHKFDLIFCGSLFTHLPESAFRPAIDFFSRSLEEDGLAVITLHGRASPSIQRKRRYISEARFEQIEKGFRVSGFGYADYEHATGYGITLSAPSWVCQLVQERTELRLLGYAERLWDYHQDVLVVQKRSVVS
jgi:SAM-dependent methyltransferase